MSKSNIEWTTDTWNPIVGCSVLSAGCANCYAMPLAARLEAINAEARATGGEAKAPQYDGTTKKVNGNAVWTGKIVPARDSILLKPFKVKKPTTFFVNSMGDLFHEDVPDEWIDKVFAVMALNPQHTFQILTKRAKRMREWFADVERSSHVGLTMLAMAGTLPYGHRRVPWPLDNVWLGVSTERQQEANDRIPELLATPAAIRFISAEPLLGPLDLTVIHARHWAMTQHMNALTGVSNPSLTGVAPKANLDWVIVGGESGPASRPMHPDWARSLRDQCAAANVPFFFKQWGSWYPIIDRDVDDPDWRRNYSLVNEKPDRYRIHNIAGGTGFHGERVYLMQHYGKKAAGRLLDGKIHDALPSDHVLQPPERRHAHV